MGDILSYVNTIDCVSSGFNTRACFIVPISPLLKIESLIFLCLPSHPKLIEEIERASLSQYCNHSSGQVQIGSQTEDIKIVGSLYNP